jgi:hypothetical protein
MKITGLLENLTAARHVGRGDTPGVDLDFANPHEYGHSHVDAHH